MDQVSKRRSKCAPDKSNPGELLGHRMNVKQAFRLKSDWPHMTSTQGTNPEMLIASNRGPLCPKTGHPLRRYHPGRRLAWRRRTPDHLNRHRLLGRPYFLEWQQQSASNPRRECTTNSDTPDRLSPTPVRGNSPPISGIAHLTG